MEQRAQEGTQSQDPQTRTPAEGRDPNHWAAQVPCRITANELATVKKALNSKFLKPGTHYGFCEFSWQFTVKLTENTNDFLYYILLCLYVLRNLKWEKGLRNTNMLYLHMIYFHSLWKDLIRKEIFDSGEKTLLVS